MICTIQQTGLQQFLTAPNIVFVASQCGQRQMYPDGIDVRRRGTELDRMVVRQMVYPQALGITTS